MMQQATLKTPVVFEPHGSGYKLWADGAFSRLVFAIDGVTRVKRSLGGGPCWEVTIDPRYDAREIEALVFDLVRNARSHPGIARWLQ
jgi:hypothetical protein